MLSRALKSATRKADRFYSCKAAPKILVLGSEGQIGSELVQILRQRHGAENVVASDVRKPAKEAYKAGPFEYVDVCNSTQIAKAIVDNGIDWVVHNVSIMSVAGENNPNRALDINMQGTRNVLDLCREHKLRVLIPSTIAVFGPDAGKDNVPEDVVLNPTTVYGITKVFMEHLGNYYHRRFGVDFRCLRYPGILSYITLPGGGTTDYAIDIFHQALRHGKYTCPIERNEPLPMMYMPDCLDATVKLLEAPAAGLSRRVYNVGAVSFTPEQLANEVKKHIPFEIDYKINPTFQGIASSWPNTIDDSAARRDWGWNPSVDLAAMVKHMAENIRREYYSDRTAAKN